jgi:hypothetical protein
MTVIKLFDEVPLIISLREDTIHLIRATSIIEAIKRLVSAHDILSLSLKIAEDFKKEFETSPVVDIPAIKELERIRRELIVYHRIDFKPPKPLEIYCGRLGQLFHIIKLQNQKEFRL